MKKFMNDNFMLNNETAAKLFNDYAKDMPIFDYHCHLSPQMMYTSLTEGGFTLRSDKRLPL